MTHYQLAKIVQIVGTLDSRKRLQKMVYLLQSAGCPLEADFCLHLYGPYSQDIANLTDELVTGNLLEETCSHNPVGHKYTYSIPKNSEASLSHFEHTTNGRLANQQIEPWVERIKRLNSQDLWTLELASTVAFFQRTQKKDWKDAAAEASQFKKISPKSPNMKQAMQLAKDFHS